MAKKPGDAFAFQFLTFNTSGALTDADSAPAGTVVHNGTDDGTPAVTITHPGTGVYKAAGTIPVGYVSGDDLQIRVNATVGGTASAFLQEYGTLDTARLSDGVKLTAAGLDNVVVETGLNARQAVSIIAAACAGKVSGQDTNAPVFKAAGVPATTRITAATDASGNRTTVTITPPA